MKKLDRYLPISILSDIKNITDLNEIRIKKRAKSVYITSRGYVLSTRCTDDITFEQLLDRLFEHSYHSKLKEVIEGYISLGDGYRVGLAGRAVITDGKITNISDISSVNIRIPRFIKGASDDVYRVLKQDNFEGGTLLYSSPGIGKTTLLRDLIVKLCTYPNNLRVALVDSRREIYMNSMEGLSFLDLYSGYPKGIGIEMAVRTMSPKIVICDEIGNEDDTQAILNNQSAGVVLIATAHGDSFRDILCRNNITRLYNNRVFKRYICLKSRDRSGRYDLEVHEYEGRSIDAV